MEKVEKKKSRKYPEEFKRQAVKLAEELGSLTKAAKQLGVAHANLHNWRTIFGNTNSLVPSNGPTQASVEEENKRLKRELAELKKVNYILKAAAAVFSQDHLS
jgi:transposase